MKLKRNNDDVVITSFLLSKVVKHFLISMLVIFELFHHIIDYKSQVYFNYYINLLIVWGGGNHPKSPQKGRNWIGRTATLNNFITLIFQTSLLVCFMNSKS